MTSPTNAREAKEFLIAQIVNETARQGAPLDDVERKMLYFTETAWMPEDTWEASETFDRDHDANEYEQRIGQLTTILKQRPDHDAKQWNAAVRLLSTEDHYLLILINPPISALSYNRPSQDAIKLILTAFAVIALMLATIFLYHHLFG